MATNIMGTGTSNLGANIVGTEYIEKVFVEALRARLVVTNLGRPSTMPENESKKVRWQFFSNPTANTTAMTEGSDPVATTDFTTTTAEATLAEFGGYTAFSKFLAKTTVSSGIEEMVKGNAYQAALTLDVISMQTLTSGLNTSVTYAGTSFAADDLRLACQKLVSANAQTHPMTPGFFAAVLSAEAAYDMMGEGAPAWWQAK